jgi:hypothetical protein
VGTPLEIKTPIKGVVKNTNYQDASPDFTLDAVNVRPFDQGGRLRVSQRSGTAKLYGSALVASQPIQAMIQTTLAVDPSTVTGSALFDETFNYANGNLSTVSGGVWTASTLVGTNNFSPSTDPIVSTTSIVAASGGTGYSAYKTVDVSGIVGTNYVVGLRFTPNTGLPINEYYGVALQMQAGNQSTTGWMCWLQTSGGGFTGALISQSNGSTGVIRASVAGLSLGIGSHLLEARVSSTTLSLYLDNVLATSYAFPAGVNPNSTFGGSGFFVHSNGANPNTVTEFIVSGGNLPANLRQTNIVAVCNGSIFEGTLTSVAVTSSGTGVLSTTAVPSLTYTNGIAYAVDGTHLTQTNLTTHVTGNVVATAGALPTLCTLATVWRGRLVLAAPVATPQNFFMSRLGTATDFDYSQTDAAAAFAGNASVAGRIGEPIVSLIPFSDDVLFIGGDHNMWVMRGDPMDGGSIDIVSDAVGMVGPNAWTKSPDGTLYIVGTGGLFKVAPGGTSLENISAGTYNEFFRNINRASNYVMMAWDRDQQGAYVFVSNVNAGGTSTHLWYDQRTGGFWPLTFPDSHGPTSVLVYDGDGAADRVLLLGGRTGFIQKSRLTDKDDDGTAISSYVFVGPYKSSDSQEQTLEWQDIILGEPPSGFTSSDWNCQLDVYSASTVEKALVSPLYNRRKIFTSSRRQVRWMTRQRGSVFFFKFSNAVLDKTWSLEKITAMFTPAGTVRRR